MKTRVRPCEYDSYRTSKRWTVEIFDQTVSRDGGWVTSGYHRFFWAANWKAHRLAKWSLAVKENKKDKFVSRLKKGDGENNV